jgi:hypothetical protein
LAATSELQEIEEQPRPRKGILARIRQLVTWVTIALTVAAVLDQLRLPKAERTWHGRVFGVPYDFRRPTLERFLNAWWNPNEARMFTPRDFGVGWAINLHHTKLILFGPGKRAPEEDTTEAGPG